MACADSEAYSGGMALYVVKLFSLIMARRAEIQAMLQF
jgi:hypothetical protein